MFACCNCDVLCDGAWLLSVCCCEFCVAVPLNVLVCRVGGLLFDDVWFVAVCDLLCLCAVFV